MQRYSKTFCKDNDFKWKHYSKEKIVEKLSENISDCLEIKNKEKFFAHVTIARVKESYEIWDKIEVYKERYFGEFFVSSIKIKNSTLTNEGPVYKDLKEIPKFPNFWALQHLKSCIFPFAL